MNAKAAQPIILRKNPKPVEVSVGTPVACDADKYAAGGTFFHKPKEENGELAGSLRMTQAQGHAARREHPAWGGRKLKRWLENRGEKDVLNASTITGMLRRDGLLSQPIGPCGRGWERFEREARGGFLSRVQSQWKSRLLHEPCNSVCTFLQDGMERTHERLRLCLQ